MLEHYERHAEKDDPAAHQTHSIVSLYSQQKPISQTERRRRCASISHQLRSIEH